MWVLQRPSPPELLPQKLVLGLSHFPFLQKVGIQTGNPWTQIQIKQLLPSQDNAPEEISEDMQLMRGSGGSERQSRSLTQFEDVCSRMIIILSSGDEFLLKTKDVNVEIEER